MQAEQSDSTLAPEVSVTILLQGSQQFTVTLPSNNLLLQQLFETLVDQTENRAQRLFQIPVNDGKGMLCFPSDRLVGMITEPPLVLQQEPQATPAS